MNDLEIPALERPFFFDGQRLAARDLAAVQAFHRELRWLHNRSLHNWGIAFGYAVTGARGERAVLVQPGYALDCRGRELILSESLSLAVPAVAGENGAPLTYYLTVSYAEDTDLPISETRAGVCLGGGAVRRPEGPRIRWQDPNDTAEGSRYRRGLDIILATIQVQNCRLAADVSTAGRRSAIPSQQPYVAAGETEPGETVWTLWPDAENRLGVSTTVPTNAAGFRSTPRYYAHVVGKRVLEEQAEGSGAGGGAEGGAVGELASLVIVPSRTVVDGYVHIADPTPSSFQLCVILPAGLLPVGGGQAFLNPPEVLQEAFMDRLRGELGWYVVWLGIEG